MTTHCRKTGTVSMAHRYATVFCTYMQAYRERVPFVEKGSKRQGSFDDFTSRSSIGKI